MHPRIVWIVAALTLAACPKKSSTPPPDTGGGTGGGAVAEEETSSCDASADHATTVMERDGDVNAGNRDAFRATVHDLCVEQAWSSEMNACLAAASSDDDVEDCARQHLTGAQMEAAGDRIEAVLEEGDDDDDDDDFDR